MPQAPAAESPRAHGLASAIKQLFREAKRALTGKELSAPTPKQRRRRTDDTGRAAFKMAARNIMRRAVTVPLIGHAAEFLAETLDWLHFWNWNSPDIMSDFSDDFRHPDPNNDLSPHP